MTRAFCERELARHRSGWRRPVSNLRQRQILAVAASPDYAAITSGYVATKMNVLSVMATGPLSP
jgi:hypothetical protein